MLSCQQGYAKSILVRPMVETVELQAYTCASHLSYLNDKPVMARNFSKFGNYKNAGF